MPDIYFFTPYSRDLHYGRELNKHIRLVPDDAWVCVRDLDTMALTHTCCEKLYQAIEDNPDAVLMTCLTNRVQNNEFTCGEALFNESEIHVHINAARAIESNTAYREIEGVVPGYLWLFPKKTWIENPFDDMPIVANGGSFDVRWTQKIYGKKILILGMYIFHLYRMGFKHRYWTDHLRG